MGESNGRDTYGAERHKKRACSSVAEAVIAEHSEGHNEAQNCADTNPAKYGARLVAKCRAIWYEILRLVNDGPSGHLESRANCPISRLARPSDNFGDSPPRSCRAKQKRRTSSVKLWV
jgi:hypothetical protein